MAFRDQVDTLHLRPPPGSEGGCRGPPRRVWGPRRGAAAGSPRDGLLQPWPVATEVENLPAGPPVPPKHPGELRGAAAFRGQPELRGKVRRRRAAS